MTKTVDTLHNATGVPRGNFSDDSEDCVTLARAQAAAMAAFTDSTTTVAALKASVLAFARASERGLAPGGR